MYATLRQYQNGTALADAMTLGADEVRKLITDVPGFVSYYAVRDTNGNVTSVTICTDKAGTEETTRRAAAWVKENVAAGAVNPPNVTAGDVFMSFSK